MQRATQVFLKLANPAQSQREEFTPMEAVAFSALAKQALIRQLDVRAHWQGGTLFGELRNGLLFVRLITPLGPPGWGQQPLTPHLPYVLGWSDSLYALYGDALDWHGNWISAPDSRLPDERADLTWLTLGARMGLFDDFHPLVIVGLRDGYLTGRAYCWIDNEPVSLDCRFDLNPQHRNEEP